MSEGSHETSVTQLLHELRSPDRDQAALQERLYATIYGELRKLAAALMSAERSGHTLQPTALVHEAYIKLVNQDDVEWRDRAHFLGVATRAMRQVLVDHARRRLAAKRGGQRTRITLTDIVGERSDPSLEIIDLDRVLNRLAALSARMERVVELRIFAGMTHREIAEVLSVSVRTAADDWSVARRWLARELAGGAPE